MSLVIFFTGSFEFIDVDFASCVVRYATDVVLVRQDKRGCVNFGGANCGILPHQTAIQHNVLAPIYFMRGPPQI